MKTLFAAALLLTSAAPLAAQTAPTPAPAPAPATPASTAKFSTNTPIQDIVADPAAKAIFEKDLPGVTAMPEFESFKAMSLRALQPYSNGKLTDELLTKMDTDLAAIK
jgi:hypothetical protein